MSVGWIVAVDTSSTMDDLDILQLRRNPEWKATLQLYFDLQQQQKQQTPDDDGWIPRQTAVEGIEPALLSAIHGKLIAFGMLKFDVGGRSPSRTGDGNGPPARTVLGGDVGVRYQVTQQGRRALLGESESAEPMEWSESA